jgi:uncharacterized membrane protein
MASETDVPVDLYIAAYSDAGAAKADWDALKALARDDVIKVKGMVLVSRDADDGKIHVTDTAHDVGKGAAVGAVGGVLVGLIFPPALLASAVVGAGVGGGAGALLEHEHKKAIKADVEDALPPGSSGIVAIFEETWVAEVEKALEKPEKVTRHKVDPDSVDEVTRSVAAIP